MARLVLTGGGTAGHVMPNLVLIKELQTAAPELKLSYIGSARGMEKELMSEIDDVDYYSVAVGKLRRYFSLRNLADLFKVVYGIGQSWFLLGKLRPNLVFSKGGYVSLPVVIAAWLRRIPIIIHESDSSPGLTTKITARFAKEIWYADARAGDLLKGQKAVLKQKDLLIRRELLNGDADKARAMLDFDHKPTILVMGGSLGSKVLNEAIAEAKTDLLKDYNLIHLCGKGNLAEDGPGYRSFTFVSDELPHFYALADFLVARAGATSLAEFAYLAKPVLLVPLAKNQSRGEQIDNAKRYVEEYPGAVLFEEDLNRDTLLEGIASIKEMSEVETNNAKDRRNVLVDAYVGDLLNYI